MVLPSAYGVHPDGDPFAARDAEAAANTTVGRMEARAKEEQRLAEGGLPAIVTPSKSPVLHTVQPSVERNGQMVDVIMLESSDDEEKAAAVQPSKPLTTFALPELPKGLSPTLVSGEIGSGMEEDSRDFETAFETADEAEGENGDLTEGAEEENELDTTMVEEEHTEESESEDDENDENETSMDLSVEVDLTRPNIRRLPQLSEPAVPSPLGLSSFRPEDPLPPLPSTSTSTEPASSATATEGPLPTTSARPPRPRSPTPVPKVYVQPETVRLTIILPPPNLEEDSPWYSISQLATEAGYGLEEEEEREGSASHGSGSDDDAMEEDKKGKGKAVAPVEPVIEARTATGEIIPASTLALIPAAPPKKKRQRKFLGRNDGYDIEDPFVDDSEIALFEPKYYHRPKRDGFFVCTGELELISETQPVVRGTFRGGRAVGSKNKPKQFDANGVPLPPSRKAAPPTALSLAQAKQTKSVTPSVDEDSPSVSSIPAFGNGTPNTAAVPAQKRPGTFSPVMSEQIEMLKRERDKESFEHKGKFPPRLKTVLTDVAARAYGMKEYGEDFFNVLPGIFPYNLFTLKKLVKREFYAKHLSLIEDDQAEALGKMQKIINELLPIQMAEFETAHSKWRQEIAVARSIKPETMEVELSAVESAAMEVSSSAGPEGAVISEFPGLPEPKKKFRFGEELRGLIFEIVTLEDAKIDLTIEKIGLDKSELKVPSQLSGRKAIYATLLKLWPEDWMSTNFLSREMSAAKKKHDKDTAKAVTTA